MFTVIQLAQFVISFCRYCFWSAEQNGLLIRMWEWASENCCDTMKDISLKQEQCVVLHGSCKAVSVNYSVVVLKCV